MNSVVGCYYISPDPQLPSVVSQLPSEPRVGPGHPFPPCPFTSSSFPPFYFSLSFIGFTYLLWHCWLGHLTHKNPSPIWPIMCLVWRSTLVNQLISYLLTAQAHLWCVGNSALAAHPKIAVLTFKVLHDSVLRYLGFLVTVADLPGTRALWSASTSRLVAPSVKLSTIILNILNIMRLSGIVRWQEKRTRRRRKRRKGENWNQARFGNGSQILRRNLRGKSGENEKEMKMDLRCLRQMLRRRCLKDETSGNVGKSAFKPLLL